MAPPCPSCRSDLVPEKVGRAPRRDVWLCLPCDLVVLSVDAQPGPASAAVVSFPISSADRREAEQ